MDQAKLDSLAERVDVLEVEYTQRKGKEKNNLLSKLDVEYDKLARFCRLYGLLDRAEACLERLVEIRQEKLELLEKNGEHKLKRGSTYREVVLQLSHACHALGSTIRVSIEKKTRDGAVYDRKLDKQRHKKDTFVEEKHVLYNDPVVQKNLRGMLRLHIAKAEEFLFRALELRQDVLEYDLKKMKLTSETQVCPDSILDGVRKLVGESLSILSVVQQIYGLESASENHERALNLFACSPIRDETNVRWVYDSESREWKQLERRKVPKHKTKAKDVKPSEEKHKASPDVRNLKEDSERGSQMMVQHRFSRRSHHEYVGTGQAGIGRFFQCAKVLFGTPRKRTPTSRGHAVIGKPSTATVQSTLASSQSNKLAQGPFDWRMVRVAYGSLTPETHARLPDQIHLNVAFKVEIGYKKMLEAGEHTIRSNDESKASLVYVNMTDCPLVISQRHAALEFDERTSTWQISEQEPARRSGVLVNGVRVKRSFLREGDVVVFGSVGSLYYGECDIDWVCETVETPAVYRLERLWHYSPLSMVPKETFISPEDPAYSHFHALVVSEYLRHRSRFPNAIPDILALGVSRFETRRLYEALCTQGVPLHYWSTWIAASFRKDLVKDFVYFYHRREMNYFGIHL